MFAAAVWDKTERVGYLFRDRLGVKPLYYQHRGGVLLFSSELSSPFAGCAECSISRDALALFLRHGYIPAPYSIYEGILKLLPGTLLKVSHRELSSDPSVTVSKYWDTQQRIENAISTRRGTEVSEEAFCERLDEILCRSIRDRMIADVPVGAFLSGGIDSSLVVSYMQQVSNAQVRTFTIGFEEAAFNEAGFARRVAEHLGTLHTELILTEKNALDVIPLLPAMYGEPFADSSQIPTYLVSKLTREQVTVALSGDAGDELFAGYNMYQRIGRYSRKLSKIPKRVGELGSNLLALPLTPTLLKTVAGSQVISRLLSGVTVFGKSVNVDCARWGPLTLPERLVSGVTPGISLQAAKTCSGNVVERTMCRDLLTYLPDDILVKVDRASMAVSLEVRAPFADDFELFDLAWEIPFALKMNGSSGKAILRKLLTRFIPPALTDRPKSGFAVPLAKWIGGALGSWVNDCISPSRLANEGYLRPQEVGPIHRRALAGDIYCVHLLWYICQFQSWLSNTDSLPTSSHAQALCST
jgi:asparagine synthase (glutamine-hydrolysing)